MSGIVVGGFVVFVFWIFVVICRGEILFVFIV